MGSSPTILVLAEDDAAASVEAAGYTVVRSPSEAGVGGPDAVVIDTRGGLSFEVAARAQTIRSSLGPYGAPVLAFGEHDGVGGFDRSAFDGLLTDRNAPLQMAARLNSAMRMAVMRDEATLRVGSLVRFGARLDTPIDTNVGEVSILILGDPSPGILALSNALEERGAKTVAAFSTFMAFDFLHAQSFDAVVVWATKDTDSGIGFCSALRRNARLFHLPATIVVADGFDRMDEAFDRGASDVVQGSGALDPLAERLMGLATEKRRRDGLHSAFKAARVPGATDAATGLYNRAFFASHLSAQVARAKDSGRPLAVAVIAVADDEATQTLLRIRALNRVLAQAGGMMGRLVRAEDMAARLEQGVFAISLPSCGRDAALRAADRISAVMACTAFDSGTDAPPMTLAFDLSATELEPGDTAPRLLARAISRFTAGGRML